MLDPKEIENRQISITRVAAALAALRRVQANLKRYRTAVVKAACEGRLFPTEAELARRETALLIQGYQRDVEAGP